MIIDFHTHVFPDSIAKKAVDSLAARSKTIPKRDGTLYSLKESMKKSGIDISVVLPVVTSPKHFNSINAYSAEKNEIDNVIFFGGIHPDCENIKDKLKQIKSLGLKGIKLHPDYQNTFIDDIKYINIISEALNIGLKVILHSGVDVGLPEVVHCTPKRSAAMLKAVYGSEFFKDPPSVIFAHMGDIYNLNETKEYLIGKNVMLDTAFILDKLPKDELAYLIRAHGTDKVLFATDSPWGGQKEFIDIFSSLPLSFEEKELISHKNALKLLELK